MPGTLHVVLHLICPAPTPSHLCAFAQAVASAWEAPFLSHPISSAQDWTLPPGFTIKEPATNDRDLPTTQEMLRAWRLPPRNLEQRPAK